MINSGNFGHSRISEDLHSLLTSDPSLEAALADSLRKANWNGITDIEKFYDYLDKTVKLVPTNTNIAAVITPFFFMIDQSDKLKEDAHFQDWLKRYMSQWGDFLDTPHSIVGLQTFYDDPAFKMDDYYVGPSGWLTFNQFFGRNVKPGKRPIAGIGDNKTIVWPADGVYMGSFEIDENSEIVVKGIRYAIEDLLKDSTCKDCFSGGTLVHQFQKPTDYHHFHVPFAGRIVEKKSIPGWETLDVVKKSDGSLEVIDGTGFQIRQQRGLITLETIELGLVAILPIGMGHVSGVVLTPDVGAELHKGEPFGFFQFAGSDVVVVFEAGRADINSTIGKHYLQGESMGSVVAD